MSTVTATLTTEEATILAGGFAFNQYTYDLVPVTGFPGTGQTIRTADTSAVFGDVADGRYTVHVQAENTNGDVIGTPVQSDAFATPEGTVDTTYQSPTGVSVVVS
jgi:hypothetical protein